MHKNGTLRDIAAETAVSISTVSRALHGHPAISPQTVAKVREAAERLHYQPPRTKRRSPATRSLASATIGILSLRMERSLLAVPAVASAISGAEAALSKAKATVQIAQIPDLDDVPSSVLTTRFDGLILTGAMHSQFRMPCENPFLKHIRPVPTVWLLGRPIGCRGDCVASDDFKTGCLAAERLYVSGHRHVAFLNPKPDHLLFMRREDGFVSAARRFGMRVEHFCDSPPGMWRLPVEAPQRIEAVQDLVDRLLETTPRPTAVFAAADSVAALVYRALAVRGLAVGRDISVISGNNDEALIMGLCPHLTTFDIHPFDLGQLAVRQLAIRTAGSESSPDVDILLPPTAVEGESVVKKCGRREG